MEDGNLFVQAGGAVASNTLVSANPCTLLGVWFDSDGSDGTISMPFVVELVDEADVADIDANSKTLYRNTIADPAGKIDGLNFAIKAGKGICIKLPALGTNDAKIGVVWR